ncbi:LPS export ABC transporter periplasmic protein LptC [Shewanella profunda]|uniref:LPS export ABC transporter periplasmic protein LptC n=1 Tax=Shewanella profunda TaxID=254793 RepID=UPI00200E1927|nr:LPS export ABC transporter periplasmic protein LptC [Shewanella profunda]MCL1090715.1 LPS export ABC transporter periplasmic protein LptC [Shewanella profunda]
MSRVTLAIIAFFGTALILYWQVQQKRGGETDSSLNNQDSPDYVIEDLRSIEFNERGQVNSSVTAKHMEHYELKSQTYFTQPVYLVYPDQGKAQWQISADLGQLNKKTGKVVLENNVIIDAISSEEPIQSLSTSFLEVDLNTMIMTSDRTIYVTGKDFNIQGQGLYADLNAQEVQLTSQVVGTYEAK